MQRFRQSAFRGPSLVNSAGKCPPRKTEAFIPFGKTERAAIPCDQMIAPSIASLFASCRPADIHQPLLATAFLAFAATVMLIVLDPLDRVRACWWIADIGNEGGEIRTPALANFNPTQAVISERSRCGHRAASLHCFPASVNQRLRTTMLQQTCRSPSASAFDAFCGSAASQVVNFDCLLGSANTGTIPVMSAVPNAGIFYDGPAAEFLSNGGIHGPQVPFWVCGFLVVSADDHTARHFLKQRFQGA